MPANTNIKSFAIEYITDADVDEVREHMRANFFKDSPLNKCLQIKDYSVMEGYAMSLLSLGFSFKAINSDRKIIGVIINGKMSKNEERKKFFVRDERARTLTDFVNYVYDQYNMYDAYPGSVNALDACFLSVDSSTRGLGVGTALTQSTLDYAKENGYNFVYCLCTSFFSGRVCEQLGFDTGYNLRYDEYLVNGKIVIRPEDPHERAVVYVKQLQGQSDQNHLII